MPTPEQLKGDFSQLRNAANQLVTIYDPLTTKLGADGKTYVRTPFTGNVIPTSRINPIAAKVTCFLSGAEPAGDGPRISTTTRRCFRRPTSTTRGSARWITLQQSQPFPLRCRLPGELREARMGRQSGGAQQRIPVDARRAQLGRGLDLHVRRSIMFNLRGGLARYEGLSGNPFGAG